MIDQMGDMRPIVALIGVAIIGIILGVYAPEWYARYRRRRAHKLYKQAQQMERKNPEIIRFYRRGTYHVAKSISEEEMEEIEEDVPIPEIKEHPLPKYASGDFIPLFTFLSNMAELTKEQDRFEGVAESAIRIVNQEWQGKSNDDGKEECPTS